MKMIVWCSLTLLAALGSMPASADATGWSIPGRDYEVFLYSRDGAERVENLARVQLADGGKVVAQDLLCHPASPGLTTPDADEYLECTHHRGEKSRGYFVEIDHVWRLHYSRVRVSFAGKVLEEIHYLWKARR